MRRARTLAVLGLVLLALVPASPAQTQVDLIQGFADAVGASWNLVPASVAVDDASDDLFTLEGETATGAAHVDLLRTEEFGFTFTDDGFAALFGDNGTLSCDLPEVACPVYEVQTEPFAVGAYVIAIQLAGPPSVSGNETFTVAVLAFDDDWPTFQDPRPNSPFVGTNKAWRVDLTAAGDSVRFLQEVTGPYEEFQTDTRVLLGGDVLWFVIPRSEFPLDATITGFRGHTFQDPAADVDGEASAPALTAPLVVSGDLTTGSATTTTSTVATTTTTIAETTSTGSAETTPTSVPDTTAPEATPTTISASDAGGGISPLVWVAVGLILLLIVLFFFFRPRRKCQKEYEAWQAAQAACDTAGAAADRARVEAERLRAELDQLRKDYPPLGFDQSDEPTIEMDDGETMSALDMALMQWDDKTRQPPVSEGTGTGRAEAAAQAAAQRARLRDEYQRMRARETELMVEVSEAEKTARDAEAKAEKACADAETAHQAYLRCMGEGTAPTPGGPDDGEQPKPEEPKPEEPKPEEPKAGEPKPEEPKPEEPQPPPPPSPVPPAPPPPSPGGGGATEELPRQCEEGAQRETDVKVVTFEMVRDRARARITIGNDLTDDVEEFETYAMEAINEASQWAAARARIKGPEGVLYTIDISTQMERVTARCSTLEICRNGRWDRMSFPQREISEPEYFEKITHKENLDHRTLRHVLQTARNEASRGGREELDRFCR